MMKYTIAQHAEMFELELGFRLLERGVSPAPNWARGKLAAASSYTERAYAAGQFSQATEDLAAIRHELLRNLP